MERRRAPVPDGWPGDDPTVEDDIALLGGRRPARHERRRAARPSGGHRGGPGASPPGAVGGSLGAARRMEGRGGASADHGRDGDGVGGDRDNDTTADDDRSGTAARLVGRTVDDEIGPDPTDRDQSDPGPGDDAVAGRVPAGRVLVVMVVALVLAMLVNADVLVERAERRPAGPDRDRALAVWEPVQDVSHALQLHRIRQLADRIAGDDASAAAPLGGRAEGRRAPGSGDAAPTATTTPDGGADSSTAPASDESGASRPPELRQPTADDPLRLWVGGDSMAQRLAPSLADTAEATGLVEATVHVEGASGLVRPDYYDWPAALTAEVAGDDSDIVVFVAGVNDGQGLVLEDGTTAPEVSDPRWAPEYRRRVGDLMDRLQADDRLVLWVLMPPMAEPGYAARQDVVRAAITAEAGKRPWVLTIDPATSVAGPDGGYATELPGPDGTPVAIRRSDGIHLTDAGGDRLAAQVYDVIAAHVDLG